MPFQSEKQRRYLWANEPEIARDWTDTYGSRVKKDTGGITRIPFANGSFFPDANKIIRDPLKAQYSDIMSQFPSKGGISPLYESAVENWNPTAFRNYVAQASNMLTGAAGSANPDWPGLKGGIHVSPLAKDPSDFQKVDWARTFQHELMHPRWEYEKKDPVLSKYGVGVGRNKPNFAFGDEATSATNPGYAGEEQWNYMHDLMYGPRYDIMGEGPETLVAGDQLRARGLIDKGMESYTPKAHDVIAKSGLTSEMKKALGFGVNPHEDTMMGRMRSYPNAPFGQDTSDLSGMAEVRTPEALDTSRFKGVYAGPGQGDEAGNVWEEPAPKPFTFPGITGLIQNLARGAGKKLGMTQVSPEDRTANEAFMGQQGIGRDPQTGRMIGGDFAGRNAPGTSGWGSANFGEMAQSWMDKYGEMAYKTDKMKEKKARIAKQARDYELKLQQEREQTIKDYSTWTSPSGRVHVTTGGIGSPESKKGHSGSTHVGASRFR